MDRDQAAREAEAGWGRRGGAGGLETSSKEVLKRGKDAKAEDSKKLSLAVAEV